MNWFALAFGFGWPLLVGAFGAYCRKRMRMEPSFVRSLARQWMTSAACGESVWAFSAALSHGTIRFVAAGGGGSLACALALWLWLRRKNRGKAAKLLGAKSRAVRDAIVRKARESARPSPVLKPSLRGAS